MTDLVAIVLASLGFLIVMLVGFALIARANGPDDPPTTTPSADAWWRDAERIKAAVKAAEEGGIERIDILKAIKEDCQ